jgi:hypothetical protein
MKLYFFQQNGIVKAGITKNEDVITRLKQINKDLPDDKQLSLVCSFDIIQDPALIERFIHEYLGINQLNVQYLQNKMVLVNFEHLNSNNDGSTEFFISNQEKIKECVTLFCVTGYLKANLNALQELNKIQDFPLEMLKDKYPAFLALCEKSNQNKNIHNIKTVSLKEAFEQFENLPKRINFVIEQNQYYLTINDSKINIQELIKEENSIFLEKLLSADSDIILEKQNKEVLYFTIRQLRENNLETSVQPLIAAKKEMKAHYMTSFLEKGGLQQLQQLMPYFDGSNIGTLDANDLLCSKESGIIGYFNYLIDENILSSAKINKLKQHLEKIGNIHEINWDSPQIFSNYFKFIDKCDFLSEEEKQNTLNCAKSYAGIYKILYNSKNKNESLQLITDFFNYAQSVLDNEFNSTSIKKLAHFLNKNPDFWAISDSYFSIGVEPQYEINAKLSKIQKYKN